MRRCRGVRKAGVERSQVGAAVDSLVEFEDLIEVSQLIAENLPFDRAHFYGSDKPIHLSYSECSNC